jgi:PAS domain S-box-containing protein
MAASGKRVLVVDDEPGLADLTAEYLRRIREEFSITTATSATDGLELVRDDAEFDCVVSDYNMPKMDGLELLEAVREENTSLPFILYTEKGSEEIASEAISAGVTDYLQKETGTDHYEVLAKRIENAISQNQAEAELRQTHEKIEALHKTAARTATCTDETELCELAVEAAEDILEFDICDISLCEGDELVPRAVSKGVPSDGFYHSTPVDADDSFAARAYREGESLRIDDLRDHGVAPAESDYRSALTIPIDDHGAFQAVTRDVGGFSDRDRELAELLLAHVSAALDRLDSEEKLRNERDKFAALFRNIPHAIGVGAFEGEEPIIYEANPTFESVFGWDIDEISGQSIDDLIVPESDPAQHEAATINDRMQDGEHVSGLEVRRVTADGPRDFLLHTVRAPVENANGFVIYTDITEQKRRERELKRQNEHLDEFVSILSHDLRDSLEVADDNARRLDATDDECVERIRTALNRIENRVEEALDLAEQGRTVRTPTSVSLPSVVEEAWETVETGDATLSVADLPSAVHGNRPRLERLFESLFRNTVNVGEANVSVELGRLDGEVPAGSPESSDGGSSGSTKIAENPSGLYVEFDGVGVDGDRDRLFEVGSATDDGATGGSTSGDDATDLGLRVVQDLARTHGWSVRTTDSGAGDLRVEFDFEGVEV